MNTEMKPACGDRQGALPVCGSLAFPYISMQGQEKSRYTQAEALSNGTLFPDLNLPFKLKVDGSSLPDSALVELQALEFVILELGIYLDTHPGDSEAFGLFQQYTALEKAARAAYEQKHGPLTKEAVAAGERYAWLDGPWPWSAELNEVVK